MTRKFIPIIFLVLVCSASGSWEDVVSWEDSSGWQMVDLELVYNTNQNWIWIHDAQAWVFLYDSTNQNPPPKPTEMVFVEGGTLPQVSTLGELNVDSFYIGTYEVTLGEWLNVWNWAILHGYHFDDMAEGCKSNHPVQNVNWFDALKWCNAKSQMEGLTPVYTSEGQVYRTGEGPSTSWIPDLNTVANGYRLPKEAEWEFALRGGVKSVIEYIYSGSMDPDEVGWYEKNSIDSACPFFNNRGTWPVGTKKANELGIFDMSGNVYEWCWDSPSAFSSKKSLRGGSWSSRVEETKISSRVSTAAYDRGNDLGFRLARNIPAKGN